MRHRAYLLKDKAYAFTKDELNSDFEDTCQDMGHSQTTGKLKSYGYYKSYYMSSE